MNVFNVLCELFERFSHIFITILSNRFNGQSRILNVLKNRSNETPKRSNG